MSEFHGRIFEKSSIVEHNPRLSQSIETLDEIVRNLEEIPPFHGFSKKGSKDMQGFKSKGLGYSKSMITKRPTKYLGTDISKKDAPPPVPQRLHHLDIAEIKKPAVPPRRSSLTKDSQQRHETLKTELQEESNVSIRRSAEKVKETSFDKIQSKENSSDAISNSRDQTMKTSPVKSKNSHVPNIPRSPNSIYAFGSEERISLVRDSIRDTNPLAIPAGYTEYYEKDTGFYVYKDNVSGISWHTAKDDYGRIYFYTKDGQSLWSLPTASSPTQKSSSSGESNGTKRLVPIHCGEVFRKYGHNDKTSSPLRRQRSGWEHIYLTLTDSYLLCFQDELSFQRMGADSASLPDHCIDLSHCQLSWKNIGKRPPGCTIRIQSENHDLDVYFSWETADEALEWFQFIDRFVEHTEKVLNYFDTPPTSATQSETSRKFSFGEEKSSRSLPTTPPIPPRLSKPKSEKSLEISSPTNVVKANKEELLLKLQQGAMKSSENSQVDETIHKEVQRVKTVRKLSRAGGLSQSFRNAFKHKSSSSKTSSSSKSNLTRAESVRRKGLAKFFEKGKRMSKEQLVEKGIYRPEAVFGNYLSNLCRTPTGIPEFLERCVTRIEKFDATVGIYRINGDAAAVQKLRFEIDQDDYRKLESSENVSLLASTLKLFFRELPEPLISEKTRTTLYQVLGEKDSQKVVSHFREEVKKLGRDQARVLHFLFAHLHKVASVKENKMDARNLATVFSPNLVHCIAELRRPQSLISEMEMNNMIVENFITNVQKIFACDES